MKLELEGDLKIQQEWEDPWWITLDGDEFVELLIERFGLEPEALDPMLYLSDYGPFDFGRVKITIEQL